MNRNWLLWVGAAGVVYLLYTQRQSAAAGAVGDALQSGVEDVTAAVTGWQTVNQGPQWVPVLNAVENQLGIPANLLARMAYQESRFRQDVIDGTTPNSSSGALGMMQMLPKYFSSVTVPRPFTESDTAAQVQQAGQLLVQLYNHFNDWGLAVAGYNDGQTNIDNYLGGTHTLQPETVNYVAQVLTDVPITGATIPA